MSRKEQIKGGVQNKQKLRMSNCQLTFFASDEEIQDTLIEAELERAFKASNEATSLMDYKLREGKNQMNVSCSESVEDEDVQRLCTLISGGYIQQDFSLYLSYNEFQQRLSEFDIMRNIYLDVQKKYKLRKIDESQLKFRSLLLMVYLEENISKLSKTKIDEIFRKNKLVW